MAGVVVGRDCNPGCITGQRDSRFQVEGEDAQMSSRSVARMRNDVHCGASAEAIPNSRPASGWRSVQRWNREHGHPPRCLLSSRRRAVLEIQ